MIHLLPYLGLTSKNKTTGQIIQIIYTVTTQLPKLIFFNGYHRSYIEFAIVTAKFLTCRATVVQLQHLVLEISLWTRSSSKLCWGSKGSNLLLQDWCTEENNIFPIQKSPDLMYRYNQTITWNYKSIKNNKWKVVWITALQITTSVKLTACANVYS